MGHFCRPVCDVLMGATSKRAAVKVAGGRCGSDVRRKVRASSRVEAARATVKVRVQHKQSTLLQTDRSISIKNSDSSRFLLAAIIEAAVYCSSSMLHLRWFVQTSCFKVTNTCV
jgi:hypothetical protein